MAKNDCPNCGKPLRPGARFCGNCGYVIAASSQSSVASAAPPAQQADSAGDDGFRPCPKCGKPVRLAARYCNNCGQSIPAIGSSPDATAETPRPLPPAPVQLGKAPAQTPARAISSASTSASAKPAPRASGAAALPSAATAKRPARVGLRLTIIAVFMVLCAAAVFGAYFLYRNFMPGLFGTYTPVAQAATQTQSPKPLPSATLPVAVATTNQPAVTATWTESPSTAPVTVTVQDTLPVTDTLAPSETVVATNPGRVLFEDAFNGDLQTNWNIWGSPRPRITTAANSSYLDLTAGDNPAVAGVTSRLSLPFQTGVVVEFNAQLNDKFAYLLIFDWDPMNYYRSRNQPPKNTGGGGNGGTAPTIDPLDFFPSSLGPQSPLPADVMGFRIMIRKDRIILSIPERKICQFYMDSRKLHNYRLRIVENGSLEFTLDEQKLPDCPATIVGAQMTDGTISFTGHGWVFSVKVAVP